MSPAKPKSPARKAQIARQQPARRVRMPAKLVWIAAGGALVAMLIFAGLLTWQNAEQTQITVRLAADARVGDAHTFYSPT